MPRNLAALIRHGDYHQLANTPSAHQPFALNDNGLQQASLAAEQLLTEILQKGWRLEPTIDSSTLLRAWQTADIFREKLQSSKPDCVDRALSIASFDALNERGLGSAANLSSTRIEEIIDRDPRFASLPPDWKSNSHFQLPLSGAESLMAAGQRVADHLQRRMGSECADDATRGDTLKLFIGHGAAFRHAAHVLGILQFGEIAQLSMYHARPVILELDESGQWHHFSGAWKQRMDKRNYSD